MTAWHLLTAVNSHGKEMARWLYDYGPDARRDQTTIKLLHPSWRVRISEVGIGAALSGVTVRK